MKYKRILAGAFALALTLPLLTVSAHPGHTDGNGGHTDSDTGDYHYHHGYEAHAHFDIDGNGTIDCPFDFDDQTGTRSGTTGSSGIYTPGDGSKDGYPEGYEDGYRQGEDDGYDDGYRKAASEYEAALSKVKVEHSMELDDLRSLSFKIAAALAVALVICALLLRSSLRKRSSAETEYYSTLNQLKAAHQEKISSLESSHEAAIAKLKQQHESSKSYFVSNQARLREQQQAAYEARIAELKKWYESSRDSAVTDQTYQLRQEKEALTLEVAILKRMLEANRRLGILDRIAAGEDPEIILPPDVWLKQSFTSIKGKASNEYPYGEYTVFITSSGTRYHCRHDCVPTAHPMHFFDLSADAQPCSRCFKPGMYPQPRPAWYDRILKKLERKHQAKDNADSEPVYYLESSNGMTVRVPDSRLDAFAEKQSKH